MNGLMYLLNSLWRHHYLILNTLLDFASYHLPPRSEVDTWRLWIYSIISKLVFIPFTLILRKGLSHGYLTLYKQVLRLLLRHISKTILLTSSHWLIRSLHLTLKEKNNAYISLFHIDNSNILSRHTWKIINLIGTSSDYIQPWVQLLMLLLLLWLSHTSLHLSKS